ncbi:ABC transporter ATP-binding protein [Rhabdothermincola salaria]|uniref:ABC transporter ATP-binding protein n=1 Tax=Rhabdothermincola salaria TaxID=2903142 RepID=UPI001E2FE791|nr:ABC transporter ATP-binding protein/permease [Rhabdothermincola salaria]
MTASTSAEPTRGVVGRGARLLARYVRAQPRVFAVSIVGAAIYAGAAVATTVVLGRITNEVIVPSFADGRVEGSAVLGAAGVLLAVGFLRALTIILRRYFAALLTFRNQRAWRKRLSRVYLEAPLRFHKDTPTGRLLAHADNDIIAATEVLNPLPFSIGVVTLVVFAIASLATVDWMLMLVAVLLFPALAIVNRLYTARVEVPVGEVQRQVGHVSRIAHESFDGALVVKTLGRADAEVERLDRAADQLRRARLDVGRVRATFEPVIDALPNLGIVVLLVIGAWQVSLGRLDTGQVVQAVALFGLLAFPMRVFGFFLQELPRAVVTSERLDLVVATPSEPAPEPGTAVPLPDGPLAVALEEVSFAHGSGAGSVDGPDDAPDRLDPVLDGVTMHVDHGEVVALVGATGAGKSTLCELLPRLLDPDTGTVRLGGVDLREADPVAVRAAVALVFQETFLFADTVRENVTLGSEVDDDELEAAAAVAHADDFVARLPQGWDTVLGERGVTLSGGQRQRLALTRALLRRPRVLVLDDATSAVDPTIEAAILRALRATLACSTLVVAHRLSTIELADRVVHLADGRVVGSGSHAELLAGDPVYARLVRAYADGMTS